MAYLMSHFWPGATEDQYRATIAVVHPPGGLPEGQTYHAAGTADEGILIAAVWESKEQADRLSRTNCCRACPSKGALLDSPRSAPPRS